MEERVCLCVCMCVCVRVFVYLIEKKGTCGMWEQKEDKRTEERNFCDNSALYI